MGTAASKQEDESSPVSTPLAREVHIEDETPESGMLYYYMPGHFHLVRRSTENSGDPTAGHLSPYTLHWTRPGLQQTDVLPWSIHRKLNPRNNKSPGFIDRKVKALLNKLTMERFDSISEQILEWANRSVNEVDGRTLILVIRLIFGRATDEETWSEMYARLCRFLMERISLDVRDEGIKDADGKPIAGGNLFRKYLLNRCQEDFERGWSAREAAFLAAARKVEDDEALAAATEKAATSKEVLYSEEYYASQKAKRRGLGLVKFIGELFKLQMLTERIMHECVKKLLSNVENPEEEEIESLCKLLVTVGQRLDTPKARNHMDIYFDRMQGLANNGRISSRIQYMLIDIIELRTRKWVSRTQVASPITIAEVHQKAKRDRLATEREAALKQAGGLDHMRGGLDTREYGPPNFGDDNWRTSSVRLPTKTGDFASFGNIYKSTTLAPALNTGPQMWEYYPYMAPPPPNPQQTPLTMQPSNLPTASQTPMEMPMSPRIPPIGVQQAVPQTPQSPHPSLHAGNRSTFIAKQPVLIKNSAVQIIDLATLSKKVPPKRGDISAVPSVKKEDTGRSIASIRLETTGDTVSGLTEPIAPKGDIELEPASTADISIQPKKLNAKKKKKKKWTSSDVGPVNDDEGHVVDHSERGIVSATTNGPTGGATSTGMSLGMAKKQTQEYVKVLFMLRHLGRAEEYFSAIPPKFRWYLVEELVHLAVDANDLDLDLISEVFAMVAAKSLIDENQFSRGFTTQMECLEDTSEYSPNAYNAVARLLKSSKLSQAAVERLTDNMEAVVVTPKEKLLKKYALLP